MNKKLILISSLMMLTLISCRDVDEHPPYTPIECNEHDYMEVTYKDNVGHVCRNCGNLEEKEEIIAKYLDITKLKKHRVVTVPAKDPECTEIGWNTFEYCLVCDYNTFKPIKPLGHNKISHEGKEATCSEFGWDSYYTCSRCDYTTYKQIPALGHDEIHHDGLAATCIDTGYKDYVTCSRCDYTTYEAISALGHDEIHHDGKDATCTDSGYKDYVTCSRCNHTTYEEIEAKGHTPGSIVNENIISPTCTNGGSHDEVVYCKACNLELSRNNDSGDPLGHNIINHDAKDATCTDKGHNAYEECSRCEYTTYEEIEPLGHDYESIVTPPTTTSNGYTTHTCKRCNDSYIDSIVEVIDNKYIFSKFEYKIIFTGTADKPSVARWAIGEPIYIINIYAVYVNINDETDTIKYDANVRYEVITEPTCTSLGYRIPTLYYKHEKETKAHELTLTITFTMPNHDLEYYGEIDGVAYYKCKDCDGLIVASEYDKLYGGYER